MVISIAGVPRAGKSTLAEKLSFKLKIANISFDDIVSIFQYNVPKYGLNHNLEKNKKAKKSFPLIKNIIFGYTERI